jgi:outer membrane protein assembly factor BamB
VIVQCDVQGDSFLTALDIADGSEIWRTERNEVPTWSTPTVHIDEKRSQIICNGWKLIAGYDLSNGDELWRLSAGGGDIPVPTPVVESGLIFITNAHGRMAPIYAIRSDVEGVIDAPSDGAGNRHMPWFYAARGNYMQTPLITNGLYYGSSDAGILNCIDIASGEILWRERLGDGRSGFTASPVCGDGRLYFSSENGQIVVVPVGREFAIEARNEMGETTMATPAISEGVIFIRARSHLFAVHESGEPVPEVLEDGAAEGVE